MRIALRILLSLFLLPLTGLHMSSIAQENPADRTISVSGEGSVTAIPDIATVRFGIVSTAEDPEEARAGNAEAAAAALNSVRDLGVAEQKIKLESLRLRPAREYDRETRRYVEIGFEISRRLVVELDDLDRLPALIAQVVQKGANRLEGISYDLSDRESVRNEALREAVINARKKAELMAGALDTELGQVLRVGEQGIQFPRPLRTELQTADAGVPKTAAVPEPEAYAAGEMEIRANVSVTFALK